MYCSRPGLSSLFDQVFSISNLLVLFLDVSFVVPSSLLSIWFWLRFFIMTKRDSVIADLPSARDLCLASGQDLGTHMEPVSGYAVLTPANPIPSSHDTSTYTTPHVSTRSELQPNQYCQRTVRTTTFKIFEYGNKDPELVVEEVDDTGYLKIKTPETFFNGIVGHVRDRHGQRVDGWAQSAILANYVRRYFNMAETTRSNMTMRTTTERGYRPRILLKRPLLNLKYLLRLPNCPTCCMVSSYRTRREMLQY